MFISQRHLKTLKNILSFSIVYRKTDDLLKGLLNNDLILVTQPKGVHRDILTELQKMYSAGKKHFTVVLKP